MKTSRIDQIADAVLYEGYILYPYRASARKNQQRFTFGRVYPRAYSEAQAGAEPCAMQTECLVQATSETPDSSLSGATHADVRVRVRFLQPVAREVGRLPEPLKAWVQEAEADLQIVPELSVDVRLYPTWHEAV